MNVTCRPKTVEEVSQLLRESDLPVTTGYGNDRFVPCCEDRLNLDLSDLVGVVDYSPKDQVITVRAGTRVNWLAAESKLDLGLDGYVPREPSINEVLAAESQCLPFLPTAGVGRLVEQELLLTESAIGFACGNGLPHLREHWNGTWRDWIIGAKAVLSDGAVFKSGSKVVKSVAGYDLHRLLTGSCDTLAILVELTLRITPTGAIVHPTPIIGPVESALREEVALQRVLRTDFEAAVESVGEHLVLADPGSCTIWARISEGMELRRFACDWVRIRNPYRPEFEIDAAQSHFIRKAKQVFDAGERLNNGAMVIV